MGVTTKLVNNVLIVTLNEQKANQMTNEFFLKIKSIFENAKADLDVHAIIINSAIPKFFSAGLDLKAVEFDFFGNKDLFVINLISYTFLDLEDNLPISCLRSEFILVIRII